MPKNKKLREAAKTAGIRLWQIADKLGTSDHEFSRRLRFELPPEEQEKIFAIIDEIKAEQEAGA